MKTKIRGLALTALLLSASNISFADENSVGDLPGYDEDAYFAEDASYAPADSIKQAKPVQATSHVQQSAPPAQPLAIQTAPPATTASAYVSSPAESFAPVGVSDLQQMGHHAVSCGCDTGCDGGCDSPCGSGSGGGFCGLVDRMLDPVPSTFWGSKDVLLWFPQDRDMPALVTTAAAGQAPILGQAGTNVVFGDDINSELSVGSRTDVGRYFTDRVGFGGRYWVLADNNDSIYLSGDGSAQTIGRPFFNINTGTEDSLLIASDAPLGNFTGEVAANSELEIWGAEAYSRLRVICSRNCMLDFIGGYSHFEINDHLGISSTTIDEATARARTYTDLFSTDNVFNGGQVGFEMIMTRGPWMFSSLTKVHLGNMKQTFSLTGSAVDVTPPAAPTNTVGGLYTLDIQDQFGNPVDRVERDTFAFAPEANFKVGYRVCRQLLFTCGYSFIYFDNVAQVGDVIDRAVDGTALNTNNAIARPVFDADDSGLWVHGIDLGVAFDF